MAVPSATRSAESCTFNAPVEDVFRLFRPLQFKYDPSIEVEEVKDAAQGVGSLRKVKYKDAVQTLQVLGMSDLDFKVSWNVISSEPSLSYSSAVHQIQCWRISTQIDGKGPQTAVLWQTDFSNDASANVVADSSLKKKDAFKLVRAALENRFSQDQVNSERMVFVSHKVPDFAQWFAAYEEADAAGFHKNMGITRSVVSRGSTDDEGRVEIQGIHYFPEESLQAIQKAFKFDSPPFVGGADLIKKGVVIPPFTVIYGTVAKRY